MSPVVLSDISKAYGTVDRPFLQKAMAAFGVGPAFCQLVLLLLSNTRARVRIGGFMSRPALFAAGVRQGCPLAPFLYLFVAECASSFLRQRGLGMMVGGASLPCLQYADDTNVLLASLDSVGAFLTAMDVYGTASGQRLNLSKTKIMMLTTPPADLSMPTVIEGLQVVSRALVLGIPFAPVAPVNASSGARRQGQREAVVDWPPLVNKFHQRLQKLGKLPLTVFGRGFASSAYAVSVLLYQAEYMGAPPAALLRNITSHVAAMVDHKADPLAPASTSRTFSGITSDHQVGSPREGGLGVLPLPQHMLAREAKWAVQLIRRLSVDSPTPWVVTARAALRSVLQPQQHACSLLNCRLRSEQLKALPPALQRMLAALAALPPVQCISSGPTAGPWCAAAPLWCNPLLDAPQGPGLLERFPLLFAFKLTTLADLLNLQRLLLSGAWHQSVHASFQFLLLLIASFLSNVPPPWVAAARACPVSPPYSAFAEAALPSLGWSTATGSFSVMELTVSRATALQLGDRTARFDIRARAYVDEAQANSGILRADRPPDTEAAASMRTLLTSLWSLKCGNEIKAVFWRLFQMDFLQQAAFITVLNAVEQAAVGCRLAGRTISGNVLWPKQQ